MDSRDKENVESLRQLISDIPNDLTDFDLLRWLKAWSDDMDQVEPKLRNHLKILNSWEIKNYHPDPVVKKYYPFGLLGTSGKDDNNLVFIEAVGRVERGSFNKCCQFTEFLKTRMYDGEMIVLNALRKQEKQTGRRAKLIFIQDYEGLEFDPTMIAFGTSHYKDLINFFNDHFPDFVAKIVIVNFNEYLVQAWNVMQKVLPASMTDRIVILGSTWKTDILEYVDAGHLPEHWGGTMVDENGDPMCQSKIVVPSKIPEELYWKPGPDDFDPDDLTSLYVYPGYVEYVTVDVKKPGSTLEWYFTTSAGFGFGVYFTDDEEETDEKNMDMVSPDFGFFCANTVAPERGKIECKKVGFYKLRFNNYPSWLTTLEVKYHLNHIEK